MTELQITQCKGKIVDQFAIYSLILDHKCFALHHSCDLYWCHCTIITTEMVKYQLAKTVMSIKRQTKVASHLLQSEQEIITTMHYLSTYSI